MSISQEENQFTITLRTPSSMAHVGLLLIAFSFVFLVIRVSASCARGQGQCRLSDECSSNEDCAAGLYCFSCISMFTGSRCVRSTITEQFKLINNSLPFNKYAFLTTHNSFAINKINPDGIPRVTFTNQEDSITQQLHNGVRALMLDVYDYEGDIWLCHSFKGKCHAYTAFGLAIDALKEIETFLSTNPSEIITLILEDHVETMNGLTRVFEESGLKKYWFPVAKMPQDGGDWPLVKDMVANNQRLVVFTSMKFRQESEGIAYQWNYMVENQYGNQGMEQGICFNRNQSAPLNDLTKSLVLINHFSSIPVKEATCKHNSDELINMLHTCYSAAGNRWSNFVAVDYYKRSNGGGAFQAVDTLNGELLCRRTDVHRCEVGP